MVLQLVVWDDVGIARDADFAAERIDGLWRYTTPPQTSQRQQPTSCVQHCSEHNEAAAEQTLALRHAAADQPASAPASYVQHCSDYKEAVDQQTLALRRVARRPASVSSLQFMCSIALIK
jgi:hypothetical protein